MPYAKYAEIGLGARNCRLEMTAQHTFAVGVMVVTLFACQLAAAEPDQPHFDLNGTWIETPWATPVINRGGDGQWDHYAVDNPFVYVEQGVYYCFYEGQDKEYKEVWHEQSGLAVSKDGLRWEKQGTGPIIPVDPAAAWDSFVAKLPSGVIRYGGTYYLFYSGRTRANNTKSIGLVTAERLTGPWTKFAGNPILRGRPDAWDPRISTHPATVFARDGRFWMLYRGMRSYYHDQGLGLATSKDLLAWERAKESVAAPIVSAKEEIASLAVVQFGGRYIGISQPSDLARRRYWFSSDLVQWERGPVPRFRTSVAAETLSNPFLAGGQWTVLYEQKDRIYRAVLVPSGPR